MIKKTSLAVCFSLIILITLSACTSVNPVGSPKSTSETAVLPTDLLFAVGLPSNKVAIVDGEKIATIDDAALICEEDGYIYYLCGDQIRRVYYSDTNNPELIQKNNGVDWKLFDKIDGTDYYYNNNYGGSGYYAKIGSSLNIRNDLPNDGALELCGDKYVWLKAEYSSTQNSVDVYLFSKPDIEQLSETNIAEDPNNTPRAPVNNSILFCNNVTTNKYSYQEYQIDYFDTETKELHKNIYQIPDMIGLAEVNEIIKIETFKNYAICYFEYSDGSKSVYYAFVFDSENKSVTMINEPVSFDFKADNIEIGDYRYIITQKGLTKYSMANFVSGTSYPVTNIDVDFNAQKLLSYNNVLFVFGIEDRKGYLYYYDPKTNRISKCSDLVLADLNWGESYNKIIFFDKK